MKMYLIGEIAKITGLSVHALRYYEKHNVVKPCYIDEETNYRYYSADDVAKFEVLKECKKMELSLAQITRITQAETDEEILSIIVEQQEEIQEKIKYYQIVLDNLRWYHQEYLNLMKAKRVCYVPFVQNIKRRRVIYRENPYEEYASALALTEIAKDELKNNDTIFKHFGFIAKLNYWEENLGLRVQGEYLDLMQEEYRYTKPSFVFDIPAGIYLCMNFATPVSVDITDVNEETFPELRKMQDYLVKHNYSPKMILVEEFAQSLKMIDRVRCQVQILLEVQMDE
ncbi:MAG: MerR family transcriptional regulator [Eubacteriales bacterium]|nr:MerR family transcriptional regulator [Eubacteriales bacterium]